MFGRIHLWTHFGLSLSVLEAYYWFSFGFFFFVFFFPLNFFFFVLLMYSWFTRLSFLLNNKVNQLYMYTRPFSIRFFSHIDYHWILGRVLCAIQQVHVGQSFNILQCAYANPNPKSTPPQLVPFGNHKFFKVCESVFVLPISLFLSLKKKSTYKWYPTMFMVYCLAYFT